MKIYTKTGDKGKTSLFGGKKVLKSNIRIESYGNADELNSSIGIIRALNKNQEIDSQLNKIQNDLFVIGTELATPDEHKKSIIIKDKNIQFLENHIDEIQKELPELTNFILPTGNQIIAHTHLSRTICRRTERSVVLLNEQEIISETILKYLNRLSDYLFVLARFFAKQGNVEETNWKPNE